MQLVDREVSGRARQPGAMLRRFGVPRCATYLLLTPRGVRLVLSGRDSRPWQAAAEVSRRAARGAVNEIRRIRP